jgi:hypothetical protein
MKLPIPFLLYTVTAGLFGAAGWIVYKSVPLVSKAAREASTAKGIKEATDRVATGKGQGAVVADWSYSDRTATWWAQFRNINFTGKLPPPPKDPIAIEKPKVTEVKVEARPLEQIIELVSLVYDPKDQGKGELSHVIVRYKPEANVQAPEWYLRETSIASGSGAAAMLRDVAPPQRPLGNPNGPQGRGNQGGQGNAGAGNRGARAQTPVPTSMVGRELIQKVWIQGDGDPRRDPKLWPPFDDIKLVRVDSSAQVAYFVRTPPPPKDGEAAQEPKEEELLKTSMNLSQDLLRELHRLNGQPAAGGSGQAVAAPVASSNTWQEVDDTTLINNVRHIGRRDEERIRDNPDQFFEKVNFDTYVSKVGSMRGLQVRNIDAKVASQLGVSQGDVLLEVNNRPVQTQAQAMQFGKTEYKKGVRTFVTKWLSSGGQIVERTYQAPDR